MVEGDKGYPDIVQQITAVKAALDGVIEGIVQDLVEDHTILSTDTKGKEVANELKETCQRYFDILMMLISY